jgi:AcrR family transcriptional regulator
MLGKKSPEKSVTEVRLVEAAAQLFARQGFKATTTRDIAQLADLNEATLFRYFPRKPDLFMAALESHLSRIKLSRDLQVSLASDDDPTVVIPKVIAFVLNAMTAHPELQHLLHVASFELSSTDELVREHLGPIFDLLCAYFKRTAERGAIRTVEPSFVVLCCLGALLAHQGLRGLFTNERSPITSVDQAVSHHVTLFIHGLQPIAESGSRSSECASVLGIDSPE